MCIRDRLRPASQGQLTGALRQAPPVPNAPPVKHVFTPGTRANVTRALESHVDAAKRRSAHIEQTNSRFADELIADQKARETSQEKKETDIFSDEEEIMPPKKQQGETNPDELVGMLEQVNLSLIHISEPTRPLYISYAVFCLKKKK